MIIGYCRTSTVEQVAGLEDQRRELLAAGCDAKLYTEQVSSVAAQRPQLTRLLDQLRPDDVVVVTKIDRLARSIGDLVGIVGKIKEAGASLRILAMNLDTGTATGELMLNVLGSVAQFERAIMLERQRAGIADAKAAGKYKGRAPTAQRKSDDALAMLKAGDNPSAVARKLGIGRSSLYRIMRTHGVQRQTVTTVATRSTDD